MLNVKTGVAIATAAAAMFSMGFVTTSAQAADGGVKCVGANACKGTAECKTAKNDCKGQNACKGQGWVSKKDEAECKAAGGMVSK